MLNELYKNTTLVGRIETPTIKDVKEAIHANSELQNNAAITIKSETDTSISLEIDCNPYRIIQVMENTFRKPLQYHYSQMSSTLTITL